MGYRIWDIGSNVQCGDNAPMTLQPIAHAVMPSAADLIYEQLHRVIISGELAEGLPLRQEELAARFQTSRIPVREALTRLEQHGLVAMRRYHGYTVAGLSRAEVVEICRFRALLEGELMAAAVARRTPAWLAAARAACAAFDREADPLHWSRLNREFHETLYAAAQMPYHLAAVRAALDKTERYLIDQLRLTDGMARAGAEHEALLAAAEAGDAQEAARLMRTHILGALASYEAALDAADALKGPGR